MTYPLLNKQQKNNDGDDPQSRKKQKQKKIGQGFRYARRGRFFGEDNLRWGEDDDDGVSVLSLPPPLLLVSFVFFPTKTKTMKMTTKAAPPGVENTAETIPPMPRGRFEQFSTLNCRYSHIFRTREHLLLFTFQGRLLSLST
jgi:hypothetical protein